MLSTKPKPHEQYQLAPVVFDGFSKDTQMKDALGSRRTKSRQEAADLRSTNWVPGVSGWRLTPSGLELGTASGVFPPGTITFTDIQSIATARFLGRTTAGTGVIEQLTAAQVITMLALTSAAISDFTEAAQDAVGNSVGTGLSYDDGSGAISCTITQYTDEMAQDAIGAEIDATLRYVDGTPLLGVALTYQRKSLFDHFANVGNVGTGEDDLYSDTIAADQLANNGEKLQTEYGGSFVASATATRELKIYFGGTMIFDSGALTLSLSSAWTIYVSIIRVSSTVVRYMISMTTEGAALAAYTAVGEVTGLTLANTNVMKITGEAAGAGAATDDIIAKVGTTEWLAAA